MSTIRFDDWVKNQTTGRYEWNDNVTSPGNTPSDYSYIGKNSSDILYDMGVSSSYTTQTDKAWGVGGVGGDGVGPRGRGTAGFSIDMVQASLFITANIEMNPTNISESNKYGITFTGVTVIANLSEINNNSYGDISNNLGGSLSVYTNDKTYSNTFSKPTNALYQKGTNPWAYSVTIPESAFTKTTYLQEASVNKGYPRQGNFVQGTININWGLQTRPMFRQGR
jgi:hypothetical protein